ncbi:AMP-binding protein [Phytohabitans flavus]|uniref:AMP-dependent synthetase n=2 Tax=Phytohabitans flavus TaxID=1076124 RepID=A0A6F8XQT5_9ACTN|nr:AMP-dependent synthetase [Phytohabitans flavus]
MARRLGGQRRLVLLEGGNSVDAVVAYLGALAGNHPVLLVPPGAAGSALADAYDPDVVIRPTGLVELRTESAHDLHPDLALLLSTSGSTGSPKLVRLSHENLRANAASIAEYLDIRADDRAATTLPMHYCYGLSVVNSHLLRGAGLILTDLSVADADFWELFRSARGTSFAGVPYTFDLLDRVGFASMRLPALRYVTQAGGRLEPERVTRYAAQGRRDGWKFFVMYGQTEATARMAYLPPELAQSRPAAIGVPIPGGSFRIEAGSGELVYSGPNVMLGYAERSADLALGRTVAELRTGDIARRGDDGLYEIVGRRSRFAKILGLRIDPRQVEALLSRQGVKAICSSRDDLLVVAALAPADPSSVRRLVAEACRLPARVIRVHVLDELPRLPTGKPDYEAVRSLDGPTAPPDAPTDLCALFEQVLDTTGVTPDDSFVTLGGDSLSYVDMSLRLEKALGHLPPQWHTIPIRELRPVPGGGRRSLETSVALRAAAIVLIVGTHATLFNISGGAHMLLGVAGFNFARFHLTDAGRTDRLRHIATGMGRVVAPSIAWIGAAMVLLNAYEWPSLFLLNSVFGRREGGTGWHFWFIEALVYILLATTALLAVPAVDRLERRLPFGLPLAVMALGLVTRYDLLDLHPRYHLPSAVRVFWLFAIGWAAAKATTRWQRVAVTAAILGTVPGYFGDPSREAVVVAGLVLLVWVPSLPSTGAVNRVAAVLAGASLYIYLTHWQVYPHLAHHNTLLAVAASLAVGISYAALAGRVQRQAAALYRRLSPTVASARRR